MPPAQNHPVVPVWHLRWAVDPAETHALVQVAARRLPVGDHAGRARAQALAGLVRARLGSGEAGVRAARAAVEGARRRRLPAAAADAWFLWAASLDLAGDFAAALAAWQAGSEYCREHGLEQAAQLFEASLVASLRHAGAWQDAVELGAVIAGDPQVFVGARMTVATELGLVFAARGQAEAARAHLEAAVAFARAQRAGELEVAAEWGLVRVEALEGQVRAAADRLRRLVAGCTDAEVLRWAATFFSRHRLEAELAACVRALGSAARAGAADARAAHACATAEQALLDGEATLAAERFRAAFALLGPLPRPAEQAEVRVRAGAALAAAGDRAGAVVQLVAGCRAARSLGAEPLATGAERALAELGAAA